MGKKDRKLAVQLEHVLQELKQGRDEGAAAAAVTTYRGSRRSANLSGSLFKLFFRVWGIKIILITILLIAVLSGVLWAAFGSSFKQEKTTFVEHVQALATLATSQAHVKVVIEQEDNKIFGKDIQFDIPGTKRKVMLIVPATVIAGVDLQGVSPQDIKVHEEEKHIEITLPPAALIQEPAILMDQVKTFSVEGLFRGKIDWAEGFDLGALAQEEIKKEAIAIGLLKTAEQNAERLLTEFFRTLGYSSKVAFKNS